MRIRDGNFKRFCRLYIFLDFLVVKKANYIGFMIYFLILSIVKESCITDELSKIIISFCYI